MLQIKILTSKGCFYVENNRPNRMNWTAAEAACQGFGSNVHLATLDTQSVGTFMLYQFKQLTEQDSRRVQNLSVHVLSMFT